MYEAVCAHPVGESTVRRHADTAASLGFDGVVVRNPPERRPAPSAPEGGYDPDGYGGDGEIDVVSGVELAPEGVSSAGGRISNLREQYTILLVRGGTPALNRFAAEEPMVDVLADPMAGEGDVNHVIVRAAAENDVRVEFDLGAVLRTDGGPRVQALRGLRKLRELVEKYEVPFVVSASPRSHLQLRAPRELFAVGETIGFEREQIRAGLEEWGHLAARNRERLSEEFVAPGVRKGRYERDSERATEGGE
ncbi:RNase P subunit p30 family protein [Halospeciosus flavus]|uniref:Ribonuclease P protein component 3 n=1 Tax=Halospeciosus flavus TaxID=3032283 RepID=A0ABD5Z1R7_9EURY|nr:RNase P subunit p30 family protein [Halospeciosus flavus]